jgi:hypothetical protein
MTLKSLIDKPKELLEFISERLKPLIADTLKLDNF